MIQTATLSRTVPLHPRLSATKAGSDSGDFTGALAEVSGDTTAEAPIPVEDDTRQDDAATGNALPLPDVAPDAAFLWQPIVLAPAPGLAPAPPVASTVASTVDASGKQPTSVQRPVFVQSQPQATAPTSLEPPAPQPPAPPSPTEASDAPAMQLAAAIMAAMPPAKTVVPVAADSPTTDVARWAIPDAAPVAIDIAQPDMTRPQSQPQPGTVASAAMVFGAAMQAATRKRDEPDTPIAPADMPLAPIGTTATHEIKVADAQQAPLDMRQDRWPHAMIERIEMLRDAADAVDTRIRLVPDALGAIDVSVKKDGDTVHVHFDAEQAATRTLLADAQPRLAELAEARGLKLAQGSLGDGGAQQQRAPAAPQTPNRPAPAAAVIADTATDDTRIA